MELVTCQIYLRVFGEYHESLLLLLSDLISNI